MRGTGRGSGVGVSSQCSSGPASKAAGPEGQTDDSLGRSASLQVISTNGKEEEETDGLSRP